MSGLSLRLARRDLRGSLKAFRLALACLALGVATIAGVGSFGAAIVDGLKDNGRVILGADVTLRTTMVVPSDEQIAWLAERAEITRTYDMNAMAQVDGRDPLLVSLKAVGDAYPLYGSFGLEDGGDLAEALAERDGVWGAVAVEEFMLRLGLEPGDRFRLGEAELELRGVIANEPDLASATFQLGPRLIVAIDALDATALVQPGSMIRYDTRLKLAEDADTADFLDDLEEAFPLAGWRVRSYENANPQLARFLERLRLFISLVGLTALLIGGIGVASAVNAYLGAKVPTIATLKSLGAPARLIFRTYLIEIAAVAASGTAIGLVAGAILPGLVGWAVAGALPVPVEPSLHLAPLGVAAAYGILTALAFAIWPLARARLVPAAALFRDQVSRRAAGRPGLTTIAVAGAIIAALALLTVFSSPDRYLAAGFVGGAAATLILFRIASTGFTWLIRRLGTAATSGLAPGARQPHPSRGGDRICGCRAWHRPDGPDRDRFGAGQPDRGDRRQPAGGRAVVFLCRHPARPGCQLRRHRRRHARRSRGRAGAEPARTHHRDRRRVGHRGGGRTGFALGHRGRSRRHLCGRGAR